MRFVAITILGGLLTTSCATTPSTTTETSSTSSTTTPVVHVIGHRGAAAYAPENTLPSFDKAFAFGLYEIELDVQMSKDGKVVLFHDETLDKKTALKGRIRDHAWRDLQKAEIGTWFDRERGVAGQKFSGTKLNLLSELFDRYGKKMFYHVEIKTDDERMPEAVLAMLKERDLMKQSIVTSFYKEQLVKMRSLDREIPLCYLIDDAKEKDMMAAIDESKTNGFTQVAMRAPVMTSEQVTKARALGLRIRGWGVKTRDDMNRVLASGGEGMTIDWPDWLVRKVLESSTVQ